MKIKYHFFGKDCLIDRELKNRANLNLALIEEKISNRGALFVNQIHGKEVVVIDKEEQIHGEQGLPKADAIVTNLANIAIGVITADCAPILFFDEEKKVIAAAHAGWRGAKLGVIESVVAEMKKLGANNIKAIVGPMIQQESYEVSSEFIDDFLSENLANKIFFINGEKPDKHLFDLPAYVEKKLSEAGIKKVENLKINTYSEEEKFFSFRRSFHRGENDCGRNVSAIAINDL